MKKIIIGLVIIIVIGLVYWWQQAEVIAPVGNTYQVMDVEFTYPDDYVVISTESLAPDQVAGLSIFNTQAYEELMLSTEAREAPPAITLEIFKMEDDQDLSVWLASSTRSNLSLGNGQLTPLKVGGENSLTYTWSGLYEGRSVATLFNSHIYVWSVQYFDQNDPLITVFDSIIGNLMWRQSDKVVINWSQAINMIKDCEVKMVVQNHRAEVLLTDKFDQEFIAQAPAMDIVFDHVTSAAETCGMIIIATE